jgi:anti-anti-sigma factor
MSDEMQIAIASQGKAVVIKASGRMDAAGADQICARCEAFIKQGQKEIILDLGKLDYLSSAGLRAILVVSKKISTQGGKLLLYNLGGMVKEVFEISGMDSWVLQEQGWVKEDA